MTYTSSSIKVNLIKLYSYSAYLQESHFKALYIIKSRLYKFVEKTQQIPLDKALGTGLQSQEKLDLNKKKKNNKNKNKNNKTTLCGNILTLQSQHKIISNLRLPEMNSDILKMMSNQLMILLDDVSLYMS